jgi:hypothetical protein
VVVTTSDLSGGAMLRIGIVAQGFSDDSSATRTVRRALASLDPLPRAPDNPLTTKGAVVITGSATVINPEGHSTIWSGGDVDLGSNNSTHTEVADPTDANYPGCMDTSLTCGTVSSSNKVTDGLDVVDHDANLAGLSADAFFENFFGMSLQAYRDSMVTLDTTAANADADVQLASNEVIWVEGDAAFDNNTTVGCGVPVMGAGVCASADQKPSIMIINGDATFDGTPHFYGLVFVTGTIAVSGNSTVYGALMSAGGLVNSAGGSLDVIFNSDLLQALRANGPLAAAAGSWRDFQ